MVGYNVLAGWERSTGVTDSEPSASAAVRRVPVTVTDGSAAGALVSWANEVLAKHAAPTQLTPIARKAKREYDAREVLLITFILGFNQTRVIF